MWRLGNNREALGLTWGDVADLCNKYFIGDETEYLGESAYRKKYQAAKKFYDEVFTKEDFKSDDIEEQRRELFKLKQQLRDERTSLYSRMRSEARLDENFKYLSDKLQEIGRVSFTQHDTAEPYRDDNSLIACLSDLHLGAENYSQFGIYNTQIANQRLDDYIDKIIDIGQTHHSEDLYICLLGDLISGILHESVRLSNREDFIDQIKIAAELISSFCADLAPHFNKVIVTGVPGNHSRIIQNKEDCLRDERADSLILWICKQILSSVNNIEVITDIHDATIATINVRGKEFWLIHGDNDAPTDAGIGKLTLMMGRIPYAILAGHRHSLFYREFNNVKYLQAGSLCSGGDYEVQKRLTDKPNQTVLVVDDNGIDAIYNVELN